MADSHARRLARVTLTQLSAFVLVARLGSVKAAAAALDVSEPAVSRAPSRRCGRTSAIPLLARERGRMELTTGGQRLLAVASQMVALGAEAEAVVRSAQGASDRLRRGLDQHRRGVRRRTGDRGVRPPGRRRRGDDRGRRGRRRDGGDARAAARRRGARVRSWTATRRSGWSARRSCAPRWWSSRPPTSARAGRRAAGCGCSGPAAPSPTATPRHCCATSGCPRAASRCSTPRPARGRPPPRAPGSRPAVHHLVGPALRRGDLVVVSTPSTPAPTYWYTTTLRDEHRVGRLVVPALPAEPGGAGPAALAHQRGAAVAVPAAGARHDLELTSTTRPVVERAASAANAAGSSSKAYSPPTSGSIAPRSQSAEQLAVPRGDQLGRALPVGAPVHADDAVVLDQRVVGGRVGDPPAREPDHQQPALERDDAAAGVEHVAADRVVDHVGAAAVGQRPDGGRRGPRPVVDHLVGAEAAGHRGSCRRRRPTAITRAPAALPSWTAAAPTPPAAACTSSVSPASQRRAVVQARTSPVW